MLTDNSHLLRSFPQSLSNSGSLGTANKSESLFDEHVYNLGHEIYIPQADRGIDRVVVTRNGCRKTVQVTAAGAMPKKLQPKGVSQSVLYQVNKSIKRIREDVDILAIYADHDELMEVNLPTIGKVNIPKSQITGESPHVWFLLPKEVLIHNEACDFYKFKSNCWYFRMDKLRQPLLAGLENWDLLQRKSMTGILKKFGLESGKKVTIP
tara:strand:+ start:577 stop:1203 length:627 start_codon:yes stop_codon:yes gene_type:complete